MKTMFKVALGLVLGCVVLIAGCAALIGGAANEVQKSSDQTAITLAEYQSVTKSTSLSELKADFGEPSSDQDVDIDLPAGSEEFIAAGEEDSQCVYYNREGQLASLFQFCFDGNGKFTSKASY